MTQPHVFGETSDDETVMSVTLHGGGLRMEALTWGAVVRDVRLDGVAHPLVLGLNTMADYEARSPFFGAIAGRFANRIAGGRFMLDGLEHALPCNERGVNHLHGGAAPASFGKRPWTLEHVADDSAQFSLHSPDGDGGYPGTLDARARYTLAEGGVFRVELTAETDRPTLVNLTNHSYFNLDGAPTIDDHVLEIAADAYLPVTPDLIPTGDVLHVDGSPYDFREPRQLARGPMDEAVVRDTNFCLAAAPSPAVRFAARLTAPTSGVVMEVWTTEPGLQFYDGAKIAMEVPGLTGEAYGERAGLCLEAQRWPDAPNHRHFPSATLRPGETYRHVTEYRFARL